MSSVAIGETVTSISSSVRMLGNKKETHCDFAGMAGAFMVSQDRISTMPKMWLSSGGRGHGRILSRAWFRVLEPVVRVTRVLVATQARVIIVGSGGGSNFRHREAWAKTVAQRAPRIHRYRHHRLCLSSPLFLLILVRFLDRSHHFDCFSVASACCTIPSFFFFTCTPASHVLNTFFVFFPSMQRSSIYTLSSRSRLTTTNLILPWLPKLSVL